jgi:hypothetical protein
MQKLGFKPKPINMVLGSATVALEPGSLRAYGTVTKPRPSDSAPLAEWDEYWDSRLASLSDQMDWLREDMNKADNELSERLKRESVERQEAVGRLEERLKVVVGGKGGGGLVRAWWGFFITGVGALLQGLAAQLG